MIILLWLGLVVVAACVDGYKPWGDDPPSGGVEMYIDGL